jgi:hypothetical protein
VGIEVKSSKQWNKDFSMGLKTLLSEKKIKSGFGVYLGNDIIKKDHITVIPAYLFSSYLIENSLFS